MIRLYLKSLDPIILKMEYKDFKKIATNKNNFIEIKNTEALFLSKKEAQNVTLIFEESKTQIKVVYDTIFNQFFYKSKLLFFEEVKKDSESYIEFNEMFKELKNKEKGEKVLKPKRIGNKEIIVN